MFSEILTSLDSSRAVVPKVCSADAKGSANGSQRFRGYVSLMAASKFTYFLMKGIAFC
jgi:hypothetical protein